eukprot:9547078-Alexandrium_andersonii.AAC.1
MQPCVTPFTRAARQTAEWVPLLCLLFVMTTTALLTSARALCQTCGRSHRRSCQLGELRRCRGGRGSCLLYTSDAADDM